MTPDPLQQLLDGVDRPVAPRPEFAEPLLARLLAELQGQPAPSPSPIAAIERDVDLHRGSLTPWEHTSTLRPTSTMGEGLGVAAPAPPARSLSLAGRARAALPRLRVHLATGTLIVLALVASIAAPQIGHREEARVALVPIPPPDAPRAPSVAFAWETRGAPDGPLDSPSALTVDPLGNLWVADAGHDRFQIFAPDGMLLDTWAGADDGDGFDFASTNRGAAAFDAAGHLYVIDAGNYRIQKFGADRALLASWGSQGAGPGQFLSPVDIAVDAAGDVYVADRERADIQRFDGDGRLVKVIDAFAGGGGDRAPVSLAIDSEGALWVAFDKKRRIQHLSAEGALLGVYGTYGAYNARGRPLDLAIDGAGRIYALDGQGRVQILRRDGRFVAMFSGPVNGADALPAARRLALDGSGQLYVLLRDRIQAFQVDPPERG